jgi:hypothetical protein
MVKSRTFEIRPKELNFRFPFYGIDSKLSFTLFPDQKNRRDCGNNCEKRNDKGLKRMHGIVGNQNGSRAIRTADDTD